MAITNFIDGWSPLLFLTVGSSVALSQLCAFVLFYAALAVIYDGGKNTVLK